MCARLVTQSGLKRHVFRQHPDFFPRNSITLQCLIIMQNYRKTLTVYHTNKMYKFASKLG